MTRSSCCRARLTRTMLSWSTSSDTQTPSSSSPRKRMQTQGDCMCRPTWVAWRTQKMAVRFRQCISMTSTRKWTSPRLSRTSESIVRFYLKHSQSSWISNWVRLFETPGCLISAKRTCCGSASQWPWPTARSLDMRSTKTQTPTSSCSTSTRQIWIRVRSSMKSTNIRRYPYLRHVSSSTLSSPTRVSPQITKSLWWCICPLKCPIASFPWRAGSSCASWITPRCRTSGSTTWSIRDRLTSCSSCVGRMATSG